MTIPQPIKSASNVVRESFSNQPVSSMVTLAAIGGIGYLLYSVAHDKVSAWANQRVTQETCLNAVKTEFKQKLPELVENKQPYNATERFDECMEKGYLE